MGYTTEFRGQFRTDRPMPRELVAALEEHAETRHGGNLREHPGCPSFYCQWIPTPDGHGIQWDGGEKFYGYVEWLQIIIDRFLTPAGITLSGRVEYRGEDFHDFGHVAVVDGRVQKLKSSF